MILRYLEEKSALVFNIYRVKSIGEEDFHHFLDLLCTASLVYGVKVHSNVLMSNHYHLLVEDK